jgi:hypothetical protein
MKGIYQTGLTGFSGSVLSWDAADQSCLSYNSCQTFFGVFQINQTTHVGLSALSNY